MSCSALPLSQGNVGVVELLSRVTTSVERYVSGHGYAHVPASCTSGGLAMDPAAAAPVVPVDMVGSEWVAVATCPSSVKPFVDASGLAGPWWGHHGERSVAAHAVGCRCVEAVLQVGLRA